MRPECKHCLSHGEGCAVVQVTRLTKLNVPLMHLETSSKVRVLFWDNLQEAVDFPKLNTGWTGCWDIWSRFACLGRLGQMTLEVPLNLGFCDPKSPY